MMTMKTMKIPPELHKSITCSLKSELTHIIDEAIKMPCACYACKKCIQENIVDKTVTCQKCERTLQKQSLLYLAEYYEELVKNNSTQVILSPVKKFTITYIGELNEVLNSQISASVVAFIGFDTKVEIKLIDIENRIVTRNIDEEDDSYCTRLIQKVEFVKKHFKNVLKNELEPQIKHLENMVRIEMCAGKKDDFIQNQEFYFKKQKIKKNDSEFVKPREDCVIITYEDFMHKQNLWRKFETSRMLYEQKLNLINYTPEENLLFIPFWLKGVNYCERTFPHAKKMRQIAYSTQSDEYFVTDDELNVIHVLSFRNIEKPRAYKFTHVKMKEPWALCFGRNGELFVSEHSSGTLVLVFDKSLKLSHEFYIKNDKGFGVSRMKVDIYNTENEYLYISHPISSAITVWDTHKGCLIDTIHITTPNFIEFNQEFMFVDTWTDTKNTTCSVDMNNNIIISRGALNCIFLLDRKTHEILREFDFDANTFRWGLQIDTLGNIITTIMNSDDNNDINNSKRVIHVLNQNKTIMYKMELNETGAVDMIFVSNTNTIMRLHHQSVKLIEFY